MKALQVLLILVTVFTFAISAQNVECDICEFAVHYIEGYLQENATLTEIETELEYICSYAPSTFQAQCDAFVVAEVPTLVAWIVTNENPQQACTAIGVCSATYVPKNVPQKFGAPLKQ